MADSEKPRKPHYPRRNGPSRPPPGVQKAMDNFGVRDLREKLDRKHQEQGDSLGDKKADPKIRQPPPDPSYNYLKDPARENPKSSPPPKKTEQHKQERPYKKGSEIYQPKHKDIENNNHVPPKASLKNPETSLTTRNDGGPKKELRFTDGPKSFAEGEPGEFRAGRSSFRGRNSRRGRGGGGRAVKEEKIENPVNIKIELSTETGLRNCVLDETTKIADIKHVPDQLPPKYSGSGRGNFRGRFRGRGSFRGRGRNYYNNKKDVGEDQQGASPEAPKQDELIVANDNQENDDEEEFADSNENYEYQEEAIEEQSPESERYERAPENSLDPKFAATTLTITASNFQDEVDVVTRSVEVKEEADEKNLEEV